MGEGELDETEGQVDVALIKLMGVDIKKNGEMNGKSTWSLEL
jgi:hypothetical protein